MQTMTYATAAYQRISAYVGVETATPHRLIELLLDGLLARLMAARGQMLRGQITSKSISLNKALDILDELRTSLDLGAGGALAEQLDNLYEYMQQLLVEANMHNTTEAVDEVATLITTIKEAWSAIGPDDEANRTSRLRAD